MNRVNFVVLMAGTACILIFGISLLGAKYLYGALIGYWVGFGYTTWIYRETQRSTELDLKPALRRMRLGYWGRLGAVTLIVVFIGSFRTEWLFSLALGIAIGVIVSIIAVAIHMFYGEGGEK